MSKKKKSEVVKSEVVVNASNLIEAKLTKSEVIDLIIAQTQDDLSAKIQELKDSMEEVALTKEELLQLASYSTYRHYHNHSYRNQSMSRIEFEFPSDMIPNRILELQKRNNIRNEKMNRLQTMWSMLNDTKRARISIHRQVLEQSDEGQALLAMIKTMSVALDARQMNLLEKNDG